jgi:hypothetical protein
VRQRHPERFTDDLGCRGSAEKLTTTARRATGAAAEISRFLKRNQSVRESYADGLDRTRVFTILGRQHDATWHEHARQIAHSCQRHHHGWKSLVARRHADHSRACRQRANQPSKNHRRVIAKWKAIEHSSSPLRTAIAGVGAKRGERQSFQAAQLFRRSLNLDRDFPMTGVIAERDGFAVRSAQSALRAENQKLFAPQFARFPTHPGVLRESEDIAARAVQKHLGSEGQRSGRARRFGANVVNVSFCNGHERTVPRSARRV